MSQFPDISPHAHLHRRRQEAAQRVADITFELGGLTYEMAAREHYQLDVLSGKAAELRAADAELGELERLLVAAEQGIAGRCPRCTAGHGRGATYCWRCGEPLVAYAPPLAAPTLAR